MCAIGSPAEQRRGGTGCVDVHPLQKADYRDVAFVCERKRGRGYGFDGRGIEKSLSPSCSTEAMRGESLIWISRNRSAFF